MLASPTPQCQNVANLFGKMSHTTSFLGPTVALLSDTDTIRLSDTFHCLLLFLITNTTVVLFNTNVDSFSQEGRNWPHKPNQIIINANLAKFDINRWGWGRFRHLKVFNGQADVLIVEERLKYTRLWLQILFEQMFAVHTTVAILGKDTRFFTWPPYPHQECTKFRTVVELKRSQPLRRKSLANLHGCPLKTHPVVNAPYVIDEKEGIEMKIFHTIARKINATSDILLADSRDTKRVDKFFKRLFYQRVDVMFGSMVLNLGHYLLYDLVTPHSFEQLVYVCPSPKPVNRMVLLIWAFPHEIWIFVAATFATVMLISYLYGNTDSPLIALTLTIGSSYGPQHLVKHNVFITFCHLLNMCVVAAYQACLFKLLQTVPRESPILTFEELLQSNYTYLFVQERKFDSIPRKDRVKNISWIPLEELADGSSYSFMNKDMYLYNCQNKSLYFDNSGYSLHIFLKEPTEFIMVNFIMSPNHPLRPVFSKITQYLIEGGFVEFWKREHLELRPSYDKHVNTPIALKNVEGAFIILIAILSVALVIFFVETFMKCNQFY